MDVNNRELTRLLDNTDVAFKQLMENPGSESFSFAYEKAKTQLDHYLDNFRDELKKRYQAY